MKTFDQERDSRIHHCKIWLIGDRCDGWEKQIVESELQNLIATKNFVASLNYEDK